MNKEFVMRGQTAHGLTEVLNFSGYKPGYAYRLVEFKIYPSTSIGAQHYEMTASITAGKTALDPDNPNFNNEGLIGSAIFQIHNTYHSVNNTSVINDTFLITQNLLLLVKNANGDPVNWQCRFVAEKMSGPEEAVANYKQYSISDE